MAPRPLPIFIDALNVQANPMQWSEVSRFEAIRMADQGRLVVATMAQNGTATRFDDQSPFWRADGPYGYSSLRYFVFRSGSNNFAVRPAGTGRIVKNQAPVAEEPESELVPLEKSEEESVPIRAAASPPAAAKPKDPIRKELRFDLALDPSTPGLEDDVFVLSSGDGTYNMSKSVKDDKVPGDKKLTLVFPGVSDGKTYTLSQVHDGEETVLVPEVSYGASKAENGPGEVVGCKVVFRECRIKGDKEDFYKEKESDYLVELVPASGKWVYVFGGPRGKPYRLLAEGVGLSDGSFRPVDVVKQAGKNERSPMKRSSGWMTLPLLVNGKTWDLYTCLSPFQLPWKRIQQLEAKPEARCYKVGAREGGILWAPGNVGREVPDLLNIRDPRVKDPGKDALLIGLLDPIAEAVRRADIYHKRVEACLESRFEASQTSNNPNVITDRRKKYTAGLLKVLVEKHPDRIKLREALGDRGLILDSYLKEQNEMELALAKKAEKASAALVKWMDHPSGLLEAVLHDYTADPSLVDRWQEAKEIFAHLIKYFEVTRLARLFSNKVVDNRGHWVHRYVLSSEAHQAARKLSAAAVETMSWLGKVLVQRKEFKFSMLEEVYSRSVPGLKFTSRRISTLQVKSLVANFFPDEKAPAPPPRTVKYWESLDAPGQRLETEILWLDETSRPMEKLNKAADSKVVKSLLFGLEELNFLLAARAFAEKSNIDNGLNLGGTALDLFAMSFDMLAANKREFTKAFLRSLGCFSAGIDCYLAYRTAIREKQDADYDACLSQISIALGSASLAVGSAAAAFSALGSAVSSGGVGSLVFSSGAGLALTGVGAPLGTILMLAGTLAVAGGTVAYLISNDTELEGWVKGCPFGISPKWSFGSQEAPSRAGELSSHLLPWQVDFKRRYESGANLFQIVMTGPFNANTKVTIEGLDLIDENRQSTRFLQNEVLRPVESRNIRIEMSNKAPTTLTLTLRDSACWSAHVSRYPGTKNGFRYCRVKLSIDLQGDGLAKWNPRQDDKPIIFDLSVV